ncbi:MAG: LysM peptidoglycan-binding domain-containing protein [Desulfobacteraceae bacterium]|nr:LysM peptidoglycan-binding domain-containing protein [Desulfobacteraceae bacterium]
MSNPEYMPDKSFRWHDSYNNEDKIDRYENDTDGTADEVYRKVFSKLLIIAAVVFLIFVILFVVVFSQSQNLADKKQVLAIEKRLDQIETEFTSLKTYIASTLDRAIQEMERDTHTTAAQETPSAKTSPPPQQEQNDAEPKVHKVQPGDSLYKISRQYGLSIQQLRDYNKLEQNAKIYPGQELKLTP